MTFFIPDIDAFFLWLNDAGYRYVVLRSFSKLEQPASKKRLSGDVDMMIENNALPEIIKRYGHYKRKHGTTFDIYTLDDTHGHGFPDTLAEEVLAAPRLWKNKFYIPAARAHFFSLIYRLVYQKPRKSGIHFSDPAQSKKSKYCAELDMLTKELGIDLPYSLMSFYQFLKKNGYEAVYQNIVQHLQTEHARGHKTNILEIACNDLAGELNLFVIRKIAKTKKLHTHLIDELRKQYHIVAIKEIPFLTRLIKSRKMRGGKWRRGGKPHIAVVVFDSHPVSTTPEDRKVHPFVFNARQFMKRDLREWFTQETGLKASENPIHSTDNEAEAIGHLPLFFTAEEQEKIFAQVQDLRANLLHQRKNS